MPAGRAYYLVAPSRNSVNAWRGSACVLK